MGSRIRDYHGRPGDTRLLFAALVRRRARDKQLVRRENQRQVRIPNIDYACVSCGFLESYVKPAEKFSDVLSITAGRYRCVSYIAVTIPAIHSLFSQLVSALLNGAS